MVNHAAVTIPFLAEHEAYTKTDELWSVSIMVATPLRTATLPDSIEVNVFGRFVNPELMIPVAQGNTEMKDQKDGLVTRITGTVANVLEASGTALSMIPVVGEFVPPLTWTARAAHKVASYFGWSKAPNMEHAHLMVPIPGPRMCHGEGIDNGIPLSLVPDNTCNTACNSTDIDEMDFSYLFERKYIDQILELKAGENVVIIPLDIESVNTPTNILTMFRHRRWMRCFEFHMVKTRFHTGRLLIQYDYNNTISDSSEARVAMSTVYSKIVDISQQDSFVFTIPWMNISPFSEQSLGRIVITTFNDIIAAETVSQEFQMIQYQSYRDVQLGQPMTMTPFAQGDCCGNTAPIPTDNLIPYEPKSMVEYTMGESVTSLRLLAKRFTKAGYLTPDGGPLIYRHTQLRGSLFGQINAMYLARAGSIRYKINIPRNSTAVVELAEEFSGLVPAYATQVFNGFMNTMIEFTVPFYSATRRSFAEVPWFPFTLHLYDEAGVYLTQGHIDVFVAAGDDYNAMFPLGLDTEASSLSLFSGVKYNSTDYLDLGNIHYDALSGTFCPKASNNAACEAPHKPQIIFPSSAANDEFYDTDFGVSNPQPFQAPGVENTLTNRVFFNGTPNNTFLWEMRFTKTHCSYDFGSGPEYFGLCAERGRINIYERFQEDESCAIYANLTHVIIYSENDTFRKRPIPAGAFIDYFVEADVFWPANEASGPDIGISFLNGITIPSSAQVSWELPTFYATFTGSKQGSSISLSEIDLFVTVRNGATNTTGFWSISRDMSDGNWYQNGFNPAKRSRWIHGGNQFLYGFNFPAGASGISSQIP
jgi:hypothetical protein